MTDKKTDRDVAAEAAPRDGVETPETAATVAREVADQADAALAGQSPGAREERAPQPEAPGNGAPGNGASRNGAPEDGPPEDGSPEPAVSEAAVSQAAVSEDAALQDSAPLAPGDTGAAPEDSLNAQIAQLQSDLEQAGDRALRAQADAQNAKRRAEQDVEKARKYALERFAGELLPVVDNLERALEAASGDDEAIKPIADGVELTLKSFLDVLRKFQVEPVDPAGEPFDPQRHQAMGMIENPDAEPNTVLTVMQKGYTLNARLIRPAMVVVSKAPAGG